MDSFHVWASQRRFPCVSLCGVTQGESFCEDYKDNPYVNVFVADQIKLSADGFVCFSITCCFALCFGGFWKILVSPCVFNGFWC